MTRSLQRRTPRTPTYSAEANESSDSSDSDRAAWSSLSSISAASSSIRGAQYGRTGCSVPLQFSARTSRLCAANTTPRTSMHVHAPPRRCRMNTALTTAVILITAPAASSTSCHIHDVSVEQRSVSRDVIFPRETRVSRVSPHRETFPSFPGNFPLYGKLFRGCGKLVF